MLGAYSMRWGNNRRRNACDLYRERPFLRTSEETKQQQPLKHAESTDCGTGIPRTVREVGSMVRTVHPLLYSYAQEA